MTSDRKEPQIAFPASNQDFGAARRRCAVAVARYNALSPTASPIERAEAWHDIVNPTLPYTPPVTSASDLPPAFSAGPVVRAPVNIDYGINIRIGPTTFINRNFTCLDTLLVPIIIGDRCLFGPDVSIYCVSHPLDWKERRDGVLGPKGRGGPTLSRGVSIGDDVWISGGVTILGGVRIGSGAVIGAGSVVTKDVPAGHLAAGNPARTIRKVAADVLSAPCTSDTGSTAAGPAEPADIVTKLKSRAVHCLGASGDESAEHYVQSVILAGIQSTRCEGCGKKSEEAGNWGCGESKLERRAMKPRNTFEKLLIQHRTTLLVPAYGLVIAIATWWFFKTWEVSIKEL